MEDDLEGLRARSSALANALGSEESLAVNAAILALEPADVIATNRLGAGLIAVGRAKEAVAVYEAGLEAHPKNSIMLDRITQARHAAARPVETAPAKRARTRRTSTPSEPTAWIKAIHPADGWTVEPGEHRWISDPGQISATGERIYRADGSPAGEPTWRVGDPVGLYFGGAQKVPVLVEVAEPPRFDPDLVEREGGSAEEGERWPWVTPIVGIAAVPVDDAPSLADLGIAHASMQQRARLKLDADQRASLFRLLVPAAE